MRISLLVLLLGLFLVLGAQAQPAQAGKKQLVQRLTAIHDTFDKYQYHHTFTYDAQGRPATHQRDYIKEGKLTSSEKMKYAYAQNGRLLSKIGEKTRYLQFYDSTGTLVKVTQEVVYKGAWVLCEETLLQEFPSPDGKSKTVHFILNKSTPLPSGKMSALEKYSEVFYHLDKSSNIQRSRIVTAKYKTLETPVTYEFYHDNKPNPMQNMFVERWYQYDLENGGLTNVTRRRVNGRIVDDRVFEYNELGYPVKFVVNEKRTKTFAYEAVEVPVPDEPALAQTPAVAPNPQAKPTARKPPEEPSRPFVLLYPNPAVINFTVKANNLGTGPAILRVYDYFTMREFTQVHYQVEGQLEALISTNGMPAGLYIVELDTPTGKLRQRLLVQ